MSVAAVALLLARRPPLRRLADALEPWLYAAPALILIVTVMLVPLALGISYAFRDVQILNPFTRRLRRARRTSARSASDAAFCRALAQHASGGPAPRVAPPVRLRAGPGAAARPAVPRPRHRAGARASCPGRCRPSSPASTGPGCSTRSSARCRTGSYALGLLAEPDNILSDPDLAMWGPIIANVWWGIPFFAITLLAALQSIPARPLRGGRDRRRRRRCSASGRSRCRSSPRSSPSPCCCAPSGSPTSPTSSSS